MSELGEYVLSGQEINSNVVRSIDKVNGGGAGGGLVVEITIDTQNTTATADKNYSEITDALSNGECVVFRIEAPGAPEGTEQYWYPILVSTGTNNSNSYRITVRVLDGSPMDLIFNTTSATGTLIASF